MISAKVIADSVSPQGVRLTTLELKYPRFIHSEFMTHRVFSRNASSSRAIPVQRMIDQVYSEPATPIHWGKNQPGMQAREEIEEVDEAMEVWRRMADFSAMVAEEMAQGLGLHKQIVNRILEPFQHISVVVTATEWDNFFELRDHEDAQPEIRELAKRMLIAFGSSDPKLLQPGEWHTPYALDGSLEERIKTSVAGCARVSYNNHDGSNRTVKKDLELYAQLFESKHLSPFEHQATPMRKTIAEDWILEKGVTHVSREGYWSGNFRGWIQNRQVI